MRIETMSGFLNEVTLIGNLGQDPEVRCTQAGSKIATISLATSDSWTDQRSGERIERTEWHRVVIFAQGLVGVVEKYLRKGNKVFIRGSLRTRKWQDQSGVDRYSTEIHLTPYNGILKFLAKKNGDRENGSNDGSASSGGEGRSWEAPKADLDDEIPF
jgi:single-strand DNA-binding protein